MDFLAGDDEISTSGISYTFSKVDLDLSAAEMAQAPVAVNAAGTEYTALPSDLSVQVRDLAREVTEGYTNGYQRAVALQDWFRDDGRVHLRPRRRRRATASDDLVSLPVQRGRAAAWATASSSRPRWR